MEDEIARLERELMEMPDEKTQTGGKPIKIPKKKPVKPPGKPQKTKAN